MERLELDAFKYKKLIPEKISILTSPTEPDIPVLTESWLKKSISDAEVAINNYTLFRIDRVGRGGGVAVYIKSIFSSSILHSVSLPKILSALFWKSTLLLIILSFLWVFIEPPLLMLAPLMN